MSEDANEAAMQPASEPQDQPEAPKFEPDYGLIDYARRGEDLSTIEYPEQG